MISYEPYKEFQLTVNGRKMALDIVRRHRLWEFFLVEKLQFGWDEVHEIAEELEHVGSKNSLKNWTSSLIIPVSTRTEIPYPTAMVK